MATSRVAERLDAPRNKISGLTGVPPLRRFFNHPTDIPLREIIEARDILIVDANMGAIGTENSKACMLFILRMLHAQLQRQVHLPEAERPRVPLLVDEAHYVAGGENVVDQIATHRAAGLEPAFGLQYFAQLGSASEHQQKILKGVLNLLQSRFLFRMGDAEDAEQATRIAMAVYATMIRDDPDSRARLRVTPEQALNFPNYYCLASWIAHGTRAPSFMGQTYPLPDVGDEWADYHLAAQDERVGPYPEELESTLDARADEADGDGSRPTMAEPSQSASAREYLAVPYDEKDAAKRLGARWDPDAQRWFIPAGVDPEPLARWRVAVRTESDGTESSATGNGTGQAKNARAGRPADATAPAQPSRNGRESKREVRVDYEPPPEPPNLADSPIRRIVGHPVSGSSKPREHQPAPDSLRELAFLDRINEIGPAEQLPGADSLPRLYDEDYAVLALLDRVGLAPRSDDRPSRVPPAHRQRRDRSPHQAPPSRADRPAHDWCARARPRRRQAAVALLAHPPRARRRPGAPAGAGDLTPARVASDRAAPRRPARARPARARVGDRAASHRRQRSPPTTGAPHATPPAATPSPRPAQASVATRSRSTRSRVPDGQAIIDLELKTFTEVKPDLSLELRIDTLKLTFDLLVELDLTARPSYNRDKFLAYDAFLCGWSLAHPRYQTQGTRPAVVFVCPDPRAVLACAREADAAMTGRIGMMGTSAEHWYYAGRDHTFFAVEADIHHGDLSALALPAQPPGLRERLTGSRELALSRIALLPDNLVKR